MEEEATGGPGRLLDVVVFFNNELHVNPLVQALQFVLDVLEPARVWRRRPVESATRRLRRPRRPLRLRCPRRRRRRQRRPRRGVGRHRRPWFQRGRILLMARGSACFCARVQPGEEGKRDLGERSPLCPPYLRPHYRVRLSRLAAACAVAWGTYALLGPHRGSGSARGETRERSRGLIVISSAEEKSTNTPETKRQEVGSRRAFS
ncbi:hypothetical protein T484DRAFT_1947454 [Baffinella frigidus]|nr:hypothetical protein T484DRAFT_1947454 [Cryptophyta sp. CCMP2293]